jgi:LacI family transcriptional regulator
MDGAPDAWVKGVALALLDADAFDPSLIFSDLPTAEGGTRIALQALRRVDAATALVCFNGRVAMGVYQAAHEVHLAIPGELSVVALDDAEINAEDLRPPLTSLQLPHYEMAQQAVHSLFTLLEDPSQTAPAVKTACRIVHRESSGPARTLNREPAGP